MPLIGMFLTISACRIAPRLRFRVPRAPPKVLQIGELPSPEPPFGRLGLRHSQLLVNFGRGVRLMVRPSPTNRRSSGARLASLEQRSNVGIREQLPWRVGVERGIYLQANGKFAVCFRHAGRLRFRTVGFDLAAARHARGALIAAASVVNRHSRRPGRRGVIDGSVLSALPRTWALSIRS